MDDKIRELIRKMTEGAPAEADETARLEWLQDQIRAYHRYLPARVVEKIKIDPRAKRIEGERRTVTIVFADLSGFTALSETMDAEDIAAVINDFFTRMVKIVFKYDGSVDKFLGDALMVLFGAPVAHQDDPERAVRASLEMQREMDRFNDEKKFDPPLGMSIGVNTGPVVALNVGSDERMEYTVIGDAVNLAARLEAVSTRGEIIISNYTYEKVAETVEAERRPSVRVKGKRKPIVIYLVKGVHEQYRVPETSRLPLVGRNAELKTVKECLSAAQSGKSALLGIAGDPGSGKTRLNGEIERTARADGFQFMFARCLSYEINQPYVTLINLLSGYFGIKPDSAEDEKKLLIGMKLKELDLNLNETLPYIGILYGLDFADIKGLPPDILKKRIFATIKALFSRFAAKPLLVQIDDFQWADPTSIEFFDHLLPVLEGAPAFLSFAYRSDYNFPWLGNRNFRGISLTNFNPEETQIFAREILGVASIPKEIAETVFDKSQGNPRFVEEIVKMLLRKGGIRKSHDAVLVTERLRKLEIAESLSSLILDQIDRLNETDRRVLQYASVLGRSFQPDLLIHLVKIPAAEVLEKLEQFEHFEGLLTSRPESKEYEFISPTTYEVVYSSLFKARRRELHGAIGRELENLYGTQTAEHVEALAHHFARSDDESKGIVYLKSAANKSYGLYALKETLNFFAEAAGLLNKKNLSNVEIINKAEILKRQGWVLKLTGNFNDAVSNLKKSGSLARRANSLKDEAAAAVNLGIVFFGMGETDKGLKYFMRARNLARKTGDQLIEAQAMQNIGGYYQHVGDLDKAYRMYDRVLGIDEASGNLRGTAFANLNIGNILEKRGDLAAALERYRTAHRVFRELGEKDNAIKCLNMIGLVNLRLGNIEDARNEFQTALDLAVKIGDKSQEALMLGNLGTIDAQAWQLDLAYEKFIQSLNIAKTAGDTVQQMLMSINIGDVQLFHGDLNQAASTHALAVELARKINDPFNEALARRSLAWDHFYLAKYRASQEEFGTSKDLYLGIGNRRDAVISSIGSLLVQSRLAHSDTTASELAGIEAKARERNDAEILALVLDIKLTQASTQQDFPAAKTAADELFEQAKKTGQKRLYAWTLSKMARIQADQENIESARITLDKVERLARELGDRLLEIECRLVSASIHEKTAEPEAYRDELVTTLNLSRETGARDHEVKILHRLIKLEKKKKEGSEPEEFREAYIKIIEDITRGFTAQEKIKYLKTLEK